jgi:hypothetical protein
MKFFKPLFYLLSFVGLAFGGSPSDYYENHLTFGAPMTTKIPYKFHISSEPYNYTQVQGKIDLNQIVNIAEDAWKFIDANKPIVDVNTNFANADAKYGLIRLTHIPITLVSTGIIIPRIV